MRNEWWRTYTKYLIQIAMALVFVAVIIIFAPKAKAASDHIVINEIYPNQISDGIDTEWVELYDPNDVDFDLATYSLIKITSSGTEYKKQLSAAMCPRNAQYYVCNLGINWLANSGATLVLRNNSIEIDRVIYGLLANNASVPNQGQSISRIPNGQTTGNNANDFQIVPITKGNENILPPPVVYSDKVYVNELLPQPATGSTDEYIELFNSSDADVDLINWQLDYGTFNVSTIIGSKEYRVFKNPEIKIGLTDTGDTTNLIDPNGDIKSTVSYGKSKRGQSYSKFFNSWQWTTMLTPAAENILTTEVVAPDQDVPILQTDITGARSQLDGETVIVTGIVSVPPGKLSSQYFYIQDENSGIQIYNYGKIFPALSVGDEVKITGEMASISGERRIKTSGLSDIIILSNHPSPEAVSVTIDQIDESFEGEYVRVVGTVTKTSGSTFYIHGSGEIQVSIRIGTGIKKPRMKVGDIVEVAGILSQYKDSYRILPIVQSDVKIVKSSTLPKSGPELGYTIIISALLTWITLAILRQKQRL